MEILKDKEIIIWENTKVQESTRISENTKWVVDKTIWESEQKEEWIKQENRQDEKTQEEKNILEELKKSLEITYLQFEKTKTNAREFLDKKEIKNFLIEFENVIELKNKILDIRQKYFDCILKQEWEDWLIREVLVNWEELNCFLKEKEYSIEINNWSIILYINGEYFWESTWIIDPDRWWNKCNWVSLTLKNYYNSTLCNYSFCIVNKNRKFNPLSQWTFRWKNKLIEWTTRHEKRHLVSKLLNNKYNPDDQSFPKIIDESIARFENNSKASAMVEINNNSYWGNLNYLQKIKTMNLIYHILNENKEIPYIKELLAFCHDWSFFPKELLKKGKIKTIDKEKNPSEYIKYKKTELEKYKKYKDNIKSIIDYIKKQKK